MRKKRKRKRKPRAQKKKRKRKRAPVVAPKKKRKIVKKSEASQVEKINSCFLVEPLQLLESLELDINKVEGVKPHHEKQVLRGGQISFRNRKERTMLFLDSLNNE